MMTFNNDELQRIRDVHHQLGVSLSEEKFEKIVACSFKFAPDPREFWKQLHPDMVLNRVLDIDSLNWVDFIISIEVALELSRTMENEDWGMIMTLRHLTKTITKYTE